MKVTKVSGNVYMLAGAGGNIGASVGEDGIVIVDDQYAPMADKIKAALKGITDKPLRFVINTHYHGDHTGGNAIFQQNAPIIAQDNVRKRLQEAGTAGNLGGVKFETKPQPKEALPIITFDHDVTCTSMVRTSRPAATPTAIASSSSPNRMCSTSATTS
jgi:glyoxylase-like metal-dependent hydrolase (beta-lactamase superfamily II)